MRKPEYAPEGKGPLFPDHQPLSVLETAMAAETILRGSVVRCDSQRTLWVQLGGYEGKIPRHEAVHPSISGSDRDISVLSLVGKEICFTVQGIERDSLGRPTLTLSRRRAQEQMLSWLLKEVPIGAVLSAKVTHLANFGAFVDLGCGVISMVPTRALSQAPVAHPAQRLAVGQDILVLLTGKDSQAMRFYLSRRELLGTWLENAAFFSPGDTVTGVIRGIREYGVFVELRENLTGLADRKEGLQNDDLVSVYIKSICPETRKLKLQIVQHLGPAPKARSGDYFITDGIVTNWHY